MIALPLEAARALFRVYNAWMNQSMWLMGEVTGQVEPYEPLLRERLNVAD